MRKSADRLDLMVRLLNKYQVDREDVEILFQTVTFARKYKVAAKDMLLFLESTDFALDVANADLSAVSEQPESTQ